MLHDLPYCISYIAVVRASFSSANKLTGFEFNYAEICKMLKCRSVICVVN